MKKFLFIIDPQNDFIEGGSLAVPGGKEALQRIVDSGILERDDWDGVVVSLDSHNPTHLGFGEPKTPLREHLFKDISRPTPWPPHCIIDTPGWEIYGPLQEKLLGMKNGKVVFVEKGKDDLEDAYSMSPDDIWWIMNDINYQDDAEIYWTGLAEDYCVYETYKAIKEEIFATTGIKHILLSDMTACINKHITDEDISITPYRP